MDARAHDGAALAHRSQRLGDELPGGREDDCGVELLRPFADRSRPLCAELASQRLRVVVTLSCEREHPSAFVDRHLGDDVRRGAEAVQADALGVAGGPERAKADQARTEQRCELLVARPVGQREAVAGVRHDLLGVAAVEGVAGEEGTVAEVFPSGAGSSGTRRTSSRARERRHGRPA